MAAAGVPDADLHVVHAVPRPDPEIITDDPKPGREKPTDAAGGFDRSRNRALLEGHLKEIGVPLERLRLHVRQGSPHRVIRDVAAAVRADLVILGKHRPRRAFDGLLGSTGERVVRLAGVPCMLVNREVSAVPRRLMVASDLSPHAERALWVAVSWGRQWAEAHDRDGLEEGGISVELVSISDYARPGYRPLHRTDELARLAEEASKEAGPAMTVTPRIDSYPLAPEGILDIAEESRPDLVFLGTHGHGPVLRALFGSVTSEVIRTLPLALVVVPPPQGSDKT
jgi:universal stress protein E